MVVQSDTAEVRSGPGAIESERIARTERALGEADLALFLVDGPRQLAEPDQLIADLIARVGMPAILLVKQPGLGLALSDSDLDRLGVSRRASFSAFDGSGVARLRAELSGALDTENFVATTFPGPPISATGAGCAWPARSSMGRSMPGAKGCRSTSSASAK